MVEVPTVDAERADAEQQIGDAERQQKVVNVAQVAPVLAHKVLLEAVGDDDQDVQHDASDHPLLHVFKHGWGLVGCWLVGWLPWLVAELGGWLVGWLVDTEWG